MLFGDQQGIVSSLSTEDSPNSHKVQSLILKGPAWNLILKFLFSFTVQTAQTPSFITLHSNFCNTPTLIPASCPIPGSQVTSMQWNTFPLPCLVSIQPRGCSRDPASLPSCGVQQGFWLGCAPRADNYTCMEGKWHQ